MTVAILATACGPVAGSAPTIHSDPSAPAVELTVFGAASLKSVLQGVSDAYKAAEPAVTLVVSTDSSAALRTQIEQGAPADVFLSADTKNPQMLVDAGVADGPATPFAANVLTIVVPAANPAGIRTPADLAKPGLKIVAAGDSVPITTYATKLIANLASQPGYPANFPAAYSANVVSKEDNVAAIVAKIGLGEGDAGIVYVTDARSGKSIATIEVPAAANVTATYAGVVITASRQQQAAKDFLAWLAGADGRAILGQFGFLPPSS